MKLSGEKCCACDNWTVYTVSFLGPKHVIHVPCCDGCQAGGLTEDLRVCMLASAHDRMQARQSSPSLPMH